MEEHRKRDTYCSYCGTAYEAPLLYPRSCRHCRTEVWANPVPVVVALVPVRHQEGTGLLVVRRCIEPARGWIGLVGGFLEEHESWQEGAAREVREECDVRIDPATLTPFWFASTEPRPNMVLLFSVAAELMADALDPFTPNQESSERGLIFGSLGIDELIAFPLHKEAARRWFRGQGIDRHHAYLAL